MTGLPFRGRATSAKAEHRFAHVRLQSILDDALDEASTRRILQHIRRCGHCEGDIAVWHDCKQAVHELGLALDPSALRRLRQHLHGLGDWSPTS